MKNWNLIAILVAVILSLAACVSRPTSVVETQDANQLNPGYPSPEAPPAEYPALTEAPTEAKGESQLVYPGLNDGASLNWEQAIGLIFSGEVIKVAQTHDLKVYLTLKDGRTLETVEPAIDEILRMIENCGEACKTIAVATE